MNTNAQEWIIKWFQENTTASEDEVKEGTHEDYLAKGWIDSFQFITFISDLEKQFNTRFSNDDFQDKSFSTIEGLAEIIGKRANEG